MWRVILLSILTIHSINKISAQTQVDKIPFILLIDNNIPATNITNCYFSIYDYTGKKIDSIPFEYHVGSLEFTNGDYQKLVYKYSDSKISINFKYEKFGADTYFIKSYNENIPKGGINKQYLVVKVYNYIDSESRKKYKLKKNSYVFIILSPTLEKKG